MIGVFDSGYGGLTVLRALSERLPEQSFLYLGDHAAAPYGGRSTREIHDKTRDAAERLFAMGCRLVILACNTASAVALRRLQQQWLPGAHPDRRLLGCLVPVVEAITRQPWQLEGPSTSREPEVIAVFATRRTVESGAYPREIAKRAPAVTVVQQACPRLAARIEAGASPRLLDGMVRGAVAALRAQTGSVLPDSAVLGCTHYPLVADLFRSALPAGVEILDQPALVARSLEAYLARHPEFDSAAGTRAPGRLVFRTTGPAEAVSRLGSRFFGRDIVFESEAVSA